MCALTGGKIKQKGEKRWVEALKDIDLSIKKGERVALIGHNGAGKSTFLRLISGIYKPTNGRIEINCTIYPMLQKNFLTSYELSGKEAVKAHYLLQRNTIAGFNEYLKEIAEFSELNEFINLPMRTYSEGMSARLLFTLLTSTKHDFLALDEGFGTGDARFYERASQRLHNFMQSTGTLVLASHSDDLLRKFCKRGLVFNKGRIVYDGKVDEALNYYHGSN